MLRRDAAAGVRSAGLSDACRSRAPTIASSSSATASRSITNRAPRAPSASCRTAARIGRTSATAASISCAAARIKTRTRDHSHVELLLREGLIAESEMRGHPMRNFVECCLGGDVPLPDMSVTARNKLEPGDVLLVCTDGLWSGLEDADLGELAGDDAHADRRRVRAARRARRRARTPRTATTPASRPFAGTAPDAARRRFSASW